MKIVSTLLWLLAWSSTLHAQVFGALTAVPTHPTPGIQLSWGSAPGGTLNVNRWTDGVTPTPIATTTGTSYLDNTAVANTIYYYNISQSGSSTNTFPAVVSDITLPFNCPPMVPIDPSLLGVDRTETFQSANGTTVSFTVQAPIPAVAGANIVNVPPCNGAGGCSDFDNLLAATFATSAGGTIQLSAGDYHFNNPAWAPGFNANIYLPPVSGNDMILAGAPVASGAMPTTRLFFNQGPTTIGQVQGISVGNSNRVLVRNVIVDWEFPNAIPGIVNNQDGSHQRFNVQNPTYYIPDPTHPPTVRTVDAYHLTNKAYNMSAGSRIGTATLVFNPNFPMDGLYYYIIPGGSNLPDGTEAVTFVTTGTVLHVGTDSFNTSFENVRVFGGGGGGVIWGPRGQGLRLSNFVIARKPDSQLSPGEQPRYVSLVGDSDSNATQGGMIIENSEFGHVEDDTFYMRGNAFQMQALTSDTGFVINTGSTIINHPPGSDDFFKFIDPATYAQIGAMPLATWTHVGSVWTFSFAAVPELTKYFGLAAADLPVVGEPLWSAPNFAIRNTCSHDNHGRIFSLNSNGLVENNVMANGYFGTLVGNVGMTTPGAGAQSDGPGPTNLIWRNNKLIGVNYGETDLKTIWAPTVVTNNDPQTGWGAAALGLGALPNTGFDATGYPNAAFQIYGNFISNTPGLCIGIVGGNNVGVLGNTCVDANAIPYTAGFNATFCGMNSQGFQAAGANQPWCFAKVAAQGAIMVTHSKNVDATSTPNVFLGTSGGLFVDTPTVGEDNIVGSRFIH